METVQYNTIDEWFKCHKPELNLMYNMIINRSKEFKYTKLDFSFRQFVEFVWEHSV